MAKASLPIGFVTFLIILLGIVFLPLLSQPIFSATNHVVISEIMVGKSGTGNADNEFIELYNPTNSDVNLIGWRLRRRAGSTDANLIASMSGIIPSHGFFLITSPESSSSSSADLSYATGSRVAANNAVFLYSDAGNTLVDLVGMGSSTASATTADNPPPDTSIERKAKSTSTSDTMEIGGVDEFEGNGEDTDNNENDFIARDIPQPQNSQSAIEPPLSPSPSETPTLTPTNTPTVTPSPTGTDEPTSTPTLTPTLTPTPTVTIEPNPPTPTLTISPTFTPSPTGSPNPLPYTNISLLCDVTYRTISARFMTIQFPQIRCHVVRS